MSLLCDSSWPRRNYQEIALAPSLSPSWIRSPHNRTSQNAPAPKMAEKWQKRARAKSSQKLEESQAKVARGQRHLSTTSQPLLFLRSSHTVSKHGSERVKSGANWLLYARPIWRSGFIYYATCSLRSNNLNTLASQLGFALLVSGLVGQHHGKLSRNDACADDQKLAGCSGKESERNKDAWRLDENTKGRGEAYTHFWYLLVATGEHA